MPKFVIERVIPEAGKLSATDLQAITRKSCSVLGEMGSQIQWIHSSVVDDKIICTYIARTRTWSALTRAEAASLLIGSWWCGRSSIPPRQKCNIIVKVSRRLPQSGGGVGMEAGYVSHDPRADATLIIKSTVLSTPFFFAPELVQQCHSHRISFSQLRTAPNRYKLNREVTLRCHLRR
jgi:hypothetical protein